jgi:hypothetical protein
MDYDIGTNIYSLHDRDQRCCVALPYRNVTPGFYVSRRGGGWGGGILRNSEGRTSAHIDYTMQTANRRFALTIGAITGYSQHSLLPYMMPSIRVGSDGFALRVGLIPKVSSIQSANALHFSVEAELQ